MIGLICRWAYTCVVNVASERKGRSTEALTIISKRSILDVAVALDPPLVYYAGGLIQRLSDIFNYLKGNQDKNFDIAAEFYWNVIS